VLGPLPERASGRHRAAQQRGLDMVAAAGDLAGPQRRADPGRGQAGGADAWPHRPDEHRPLAVEPAGGQVGDLDVGHRHRRAADPVDRRPHDAALLPLQARAGRDERVVGQALAVRAVAGDRAGHQPRVPRGQRGCVDPELGRLRGRERLDQHVGGRRQLPQDLAMTG